MKDCDLGIVDNKHDLQLTDLESKCLDTLQQRGAGEKVAISAADLARAVGLEDYASEGGTDEGKRDLRHLINHLIISHSIPIMCKAGFKGGYFLPGDETEVQRFYGAFHRRAMTGLVKASRGRKASFVDIMTQLSLGFDDPETKEALEQLRLTADADPVPAWVQIATRLLDRISDDPERYAAEIRKLQGKYGDIFVRREKVSELKRMTAQFQELLKEIA